MYLYFSFKFIKKRFTRINLQYVESAIRDLRVINKYIIVQTK